MTNRTLVLCGNRNWHRNTKRHIKGQSKKNPQKMSNMDPTKNPGVKISVYTFFYTSIVYTYFIFIEQRYLRRFMRLEPLISHTGMLMTFYLSIILDLQNFFHWYILQSWKLKRPQIQLRPHHFWTYNSNLTTVVNSVLNFMINGTTSILKS